jgi:hypothetical protein
LRFVVEEILANVFDVKLGSLGDNSGFVMFFGF